VIATEMAVFSGFGARECLGPLGVNTYYK